ncbi:MAG: transposase [Candidatus Sedimenticola endophacoides]
MSRAYTEAIKHHCPNARLVIDRFHVRLFHLPHQNVT